MNDPFEKFYSSCFFKIPSGEWNPTWTAEVKASRVVAQGGDYLNGYLYKYPIYNSESGSMYLTYTAEQAAVMNKIVLAKVKAGFSFNQSKGIGFVSVLNARDKFSDTYVNAETKEKIETLIQTNNSETGVGFTSRAEAREYKKYLQDVGLWDLTDEEIDILLDPLPLDREEFFKQKAIGWPSAMIYFPIGDVEIVLKDDTGAVKGWLTYYQTTGSQNKLLSSTEEPNYGFQELSEIPRNAVYDRYGDLIFYNAFGKWYTSDEQQQADIAADNWYRSTNYKDTIASRAIVPCSFTIPEVPEPPPPPPPPPAIAEPKLGWAKATVSFDTYDGYLDYNILVNESSDPYKSTNAYTFGYDVIERLYRENINEFSQRRPLPVAYGVSLEDGPINWDTDEVQLFDEFGTQNNWLFECIPVIWQESDLNINAPALPESKRKTYGFTNLVGNFTRDETNVDVIYPGYAFAYIVLFRNGIALGYITLKIDITSHLSEMSNFKIEFIEWRPGMPTFN